MVTRNRTRLVFILGAGASVHTGVPVARDFLERAFQLLDRRLPDGSPLIPADCYRAECIHDVMRAQREVIAASAYGPPSHAGLEALFSAIEVLSLVGDFTTASVGPSLDHKDLRRSMTTVIAETVAQSQEFKLARDGPASDQPYGFLLKGLKDLAAQRRIGLGDVVFITFNYDLGLEVMLAASGLEFHRACKGEENFSIEGKGPTVIKLHGSIDEFRCVRSECDGFVAPKKITQMHRQLQDVRVAGDERVARYPWWERLIATKCPKCQCGVTAAVVPPTWSKLGHYDRTAAVWHRAASELSQAEVIVSIGYSIPPEDRQFPLFWQLSRRGKMPLRALAVINPEDEAMERHSSMFRGVSEQRYSLIEGHAYGGPGESLFNTATVVELLEWLRRRFV